MDGSSDGHLPNRGMATVSRPVSLVEAFEMGFDLAASLRGQALKDSRAVGRLLGRTTFDSISDAVDRELKARGFDNFKDADNGVWQVKRILHAALATAETRLVDPDECAR